MGIARRIVEQRDRLALNRAAPYLEENEELIHWVRVRQVEGRGEGFAFVTKRQLVVHWQGRSEDPQTFQWDELEAWGIEADAKGGPVLSVESERKEAAVRIPAGSRSVADKAKKFLRSFAEHAPNPSRGLSANPSSAQVKSVKEIQVSPSKRTAWEQTRRIIVTVLGVALILFGVAVGWLPVFPFWLPILAGLALLATEYDWAKDASDWVKDNYQEAKKKIKARQKRSR